MDEIFNKLKDFIAESPEYIYLLIGVVFCVFFIGVIKDKKWAIDPESGRQRMFYNTFGHNGFRMLIGGVYLLGTLAGFGGYLLNS